MHGIAAASGPSSPCALSARNLTKSFSRGLARAPRRVAAIAGVEFDATCGEVVAVTGAGGAGKTTLLQCLCGLLRPDSGNVRLFGEAVVPGRVPRGVIYVPAVPLYYPFLTPRDILPAGAVASRALMLDGVMDRRFYHLDRKYIRRVAVAHAIAARPDVVLMDSDGADPMTDHFVIDALIGLAASGAAVMIAMRDASEIRGAFARMFVLPHGASVPRSPAHSFSPARLVAERAH